MMFQSKVLNVYKIIPYSIANTSKISMKVRKNKVTEEKSVAKMIMMIKAK